MNAKNVNFLAILSLIFMVSACAPQLGSGGSTATTTTSTVPGGNEPAARFIFHKDNFTDLSDYVVSQHSTYQCLGDGTKTFYVSGADYAGAPSAFPTADSVDSFLPTTKPAFIKNVSVDITNTYFPNVVSSVVQSDNCSYRGITGSSDPSPCADFDEAQTVVPTPTIAPTPTVSPAPSPAATPSTTAYYGSKFYRVRDDWCTGQGPILTGNADTTKAYVGGVSIDLDRTAMGAGEDLLMNITYQSLNSNAAWPGVQQAATSFYPLGNDETILEVNLVGTALGLDLLIGAKQPRAWSTYASANVPVYLKNVATIRDPFGSLRTEQVYLPVSQNALIDRIRIDRVRGSFHLYQVDLYRLGNRVN